MKEEWYYPRQLTERLGVQSNAVTVSLYSFIINVTRPTKRFGITYWLAVRIRPKSPFPSTIVYYVNNVC